jgi:hypothetical protein
MGGDVARTGAMNIKYNIFVEKPERKGGWETRAQTEHIKNWESGCLLVLTADSSEHDNELFFFPTHSREIAPQTVYLIQLNTSWWLL